MLSVGPSCARGCHVFAVCMLSYETSGVCVVVWQLLSRQFAMAAVAPLPAGRGAAALPPADGFHMNWSYSEYGPAHPVVNPDLVSYIGVVDAFDSVLMDVLASHGFSEAKKRHSSHGT